jgi:MFS family permease
MHIQYILDNDFTITNYLGLYCARQGERELIQSLLSIGSLLGLITMNFLSDIKGRKFALIGSLCIGLLSAFCKEWVII